MESLKFTEVEDLIEGLSEHQVRIGPGKEAKTVQIMLLPTDGQSPIELVLNELHANKMMAQIATAMAQSKSIETRYYRGTP